MSTRRLLYSRMFRYCDGFFGISYSSICGIPIRPSVRPARRRPGHSSLRIEPLEERFLLSVAPGIEPAAYDAEQLIPLGEVAGQYGHDWSVPTAEMDEGRIGFDLDTSAYFDNGGGPAVAATPTGLSYMLYDAWGGTWSDAEKSPVNSEDDLMCWAGAASNILEWTGWGLVDGMTDTDEIFAYFQDHWTDQGGLMEFGWEWWFSGVNSSQGWSGWSQVDVAGGGFHSSEDFSEYHFTQSNDAQAMASIDQYLHNGCGTTIGIYGPGGHAITVWGYNYDAADPTDYVGIWVTDSDDSKYTTSPPDSLRYYEISYASGRWYLQDCYGSGSWYIGWVDALAQSPSQPPPPETNPIIDNGAAGFSATAGWSSYAGEGYESDIHYSAPGSGSELATWTFDVTPGQYQVAATWLQGGNRATNSPFTVLDGATVVNTVQLNQELAPNDYTDAGVSWENIGTFNITGNTLTVQLSDDANDFAIADAIQIQRVGEVLLEPEIRVTIDGANIVDGTGSIDFGTTTVGDSVSKNVILTNDGNSILTLDGTISLPSGFSVSGFDSSPLAPGYSTILALRLDAGAPGTYSGQFSLGNNDSDENPFNFTVTGTVAGPSAIQTLDNGDAGFSTNGTWTQYWGEGFQNDIHYSTAGSGSDSTSWNFDVTSGQYQVAATWLQGNNRATDSPFTILDGATPLGTVDVNQELAPGDFSDQGALWKNLGTFNVTGSTLEVRLTDDADQYVIADAIRIERIGDLPSGPEIQVTVDGANVADGAGNIDFGTTVVDQDVTKTFTVTNLGYDPLTFSSGISLPAGFSVASGFSVMGLSCGESTTFSVKLDATAEGTYSGTLSFNNNDADEGTFDFTIGGTVTAAAAPASAQIVDNGEAGFSTSSGWTQYLNEGYNNDIHYSFKGNGSNVATWSFDVTAGQYEVAATWLQSGNRATDSPFTVLDGDTALATVDVNQELAPNDFTDQGAGWKTLGTFNMTGGTLNVQLSDDANDFVIADAIRIRRVGDYSVIDNGDAGFSTTAGWTPYSGEGFENDIHYSLKGNGSQVATWDFTVAPGDYQVAATWLQGSNRATDSPFTVFDAASAVQTVAVNQEAAPADFNDQGVGWKNLGTFTITSNTLAVKLGDNANDFVIADGIRIQQIGGASGIPEVSNASLNPASARQDGPLTSLSGLDHLLSADIHSELRWLSSTAADLVNTGINAGRTDLVSSCDDAADGGQSQFLEGRAATSGLRSPLDTGSLSQLRSNWSTDMTGIDKTGTDKTRAIDFVLEAEGDWMDWHAPPE